MPAKRQRRRPPRGRRINQHRGTIRLGLVLTLLVGVNLYVFWFRGGTSIPEVQKAAMAADSPASDELLEGEVGVAPAPGDPLPEGDEAPDEQGAWLDGAIEKGDSIGRVMKHHGFDAQQTDELVRALRPHMEFRAIRVGQTYRIHTRDDGNLDAFEYDLSRVQKVVVERNAAGELVGKKLEADTQVRRHRVGGVVESSLYHAVKDAGEDTALVGFLVDVFAFDLNFYIDQHKGDTFKIVVEKEYLGDEFLRYRKVRAAEYSGKAGTFRAFYWESEDGKVKGYYNEKGEAIARTFLKTPLKYSRISSKFNPNRMHPVLHKRRAHMGVDYAAATGTPVWAAASGKIVARGWGGGAGNRVVIDHGNGYKTVYMHLSRFRKGQSVGQTVKQKTVIGYVGATGLATGAHLHFSVKKHGKYIDPLKMKMARGPGVPKAYRAAFDAEISDLVAQLGEVSTGAVTAATGE